MAARLTPQPGLLRLRWLCLALAAVVGTVAFGVLSATGSRAALSYLGGVVFTTVILEVSTFNVRYTDRFLPKLTLPVAVLSYFLTATALAVALAASSPRVVDGAGVAVGLVAVVVIWVGTEIARLRVRS